MIKSICQSRSHTNEAPPTLSKLSPTEVVAKPNDEHRALPKVEHDAKPKVEHDANPKVEHGAKPTPKAFARKFRENALR